ncbi:uL15 family ribosomal protein [Candidatus Micrarchaeota archaeon]|nr:uL15 family ribosomal protein [Candidatus Micrarchaeota archaeon]MBU1165932.1 uL15 family ribosomal protein [Candidatus Micrarchaeota archaeon]MBU1886836.1 uL15 family ribosomal protein [Candidatus Micrarchaeota archaeon]
MKRKAKQKSKYLGTRSFGRGNVKNRRGSGNRGGRGNAGRCKHKGTWVAKYDKDYFGKFGFSRPVKKTIVSVVHLYEINRKAVLEKLEKHGSKYTFEFNGRVLATGKVTMPLSIRAASWSKNVEKKLSETGGEISKLAA